MHTRVCWGNGSHLPDSSAYKPCTFDVPESCFIVSVSSSETSSPHPQVLRFIGHWLNSIAVRAPDAPVILVGTHKDMLKKIFVNSNKYQQKKIIETQKVLIDFLNKLFVTKKTRLIDNIKRPSGDGGAWFFAVDNKSRKTKRGGEMDPTIHGFRKALEQVVINDQRKVQGL